MKFEICDYLKSTDRRSHFIHWCRLVLTKCSIDINKICITLVHDCRKWFKRLLTLFSVIWVNDSFFTEEFPLSINFAYYILYLAP